VIEIKERDGEVTFMVRLAPRASRDAIEGEHDGSLKVRVMAPPVDGRANEALRRLLAERLRVAMTAVRIVAGEKSRTKRVSVAGVTKAQIVTIAEASRNPAIK
jgi:uncharacterized protein